MEKLQDKKGNNRNDSSEERIQHVLNTKAPPTLNMNEVLSQLKDAHKKKVIGLKTKKLISVKKKKDDGKRQSQIEYVNTMTKRMPILTSKFDDFNLQLHRVYAKQLNNYEDQVHSSNRRLPRGMHSFNSPQANRDGFTLLNPLLQATDYMPYSRKARDYSYGNLRPDQINFNEQD